MVDELAAARQRRDTASDATAREYKRILSIIDGLHKKAHYSAEFIIRIIREKSECIRNRHTYVFHPVIEGRVCEVCGKPEKENYS